MTHANPRHILDPRKKFIDPSQSFINHVTQATHATSWPTPSTNPRTHTTTQPSKPHIPHNSADSRGMGALLRKNSLLKFQWADVECRGFWFISFLILYNQKISSYSNIPVDTRRRFNVYKTAIRHRRRRIDVL